MRETFDSFIAFHVNGISNLLYVLTTNWWFLLIMAAAIACIVMYLKDAVESTVHEEQQVL